MHVRSGPDDLESRFRSGCSRATRWNMFAASWATTTLKRPRVVLPMCSSGNPPRARPDGYWDYEPDYIGLGYETDPVLRKRLEETPHANAVRVERDLAEGRRRFPVAEKLRQLAAGLPAETALIVVFPPSYKNNHAAPRHRAGLSRRRLQGGHYRGRRGHTRNPPLSTGASIGPRIGTRTSIST